MRKPFFLFSKEETDTKVANNRLLAYAVGLAGQNMNYNYVSSRLFVFINTVLRIPSEKTGWITSVSTLWDAVNDPIVGSLLDRRNFKPGRKMRPFLLYMPPIVGILTALLFMDFSMSQTQTIVFIVATYLAIDVFYSIQDVALWGMIPLSSPNSEERGRVSQWVSIGAGAGSAIGGLFPSVRQIIVDNNLATEKTAYFIGGVVFGLGGMLISMFAYRMKEKVEYIPSKKESILKSLAKLRFNKTLIIICLARFIGGLSLTLPWEYFFYTDGISYNIFGMNIAGGNAQLIYGTLIGIPGALAIFFATKIAHKLGGMKRLLMFSEIVAIILRVICFIIGDGERYLNFGVLAIIMVIMSISQILTGLKDIAHRSLISDSIDDMELKTGERTEGISFSMQNFISKLTSAAAKLIQGYLLKFMKFDSSLPIEKQTGRFVKYRWHQFMLGPVVGSALYLIAILFLNDDHEHVADVERQLKEKRSHAEELAQEAEIK